MEGDRVRRISRHAVSMQCNRWRHKLRTHFTYVVCDSLNPITPCINLLLPAMALNETTTSAVLQNMIFPPVPHPTPISTIFPNFIKT